MNDNNTELIPIPTTHSPPILDEGCLHTYQQYCVDFLERHPQCALFLDCGLGKTIITLTAIQHLMYDSFDVHRVLIIAPLRVARDTWIAELSKWATGKENNHEKDCIFDCFIIDERRMLGTGI